jgi:hypothetical protein
MINKKLGWIELKRLWWTSKINVLKSSRRGEGENIFILKFRNESIDLLKNYSDKSV